MITLIFRTKLLVKSAMYRLFVSGSIAAPQGPRNDATLPVPSALPLLVFPANTVTNPETVLTCLIRLLLGSVTYKIFVVVSIAAPSGLSKRAVLPIPSTIPVAGVPASVVTMPSTAVDADGTSVGMVVGVAVGILLGNDDGVSVGVEVG